MRGRNLLLRDWCFSVGLPGRACQIFWPCLITFAMGDSSYGEPVQKYVDDYYSLRSSNDNDWADPVGVSSLGVVDISIVPDVFGVRAFDSRESISRMLPGQFPNELHVLIPDAGATPVAFHDIDMSDLRATPEWRARRIVPSDVTLAEDFACHHAQTTGTHGEPPPCV